MRLGELFSRSRASAVVSLATVAAACLLVGCETQGLIDPGEMMRTEKTTLLVPVLPTLDPRDEVEPEFANAEDVKQADLKASTTDYVIGRNDLLSISITEVAGPGLETVKTSRVSESGMVSLPLIGTVKAAGSTEADLEKSIAQTYRDRNLIQNAQVSVTVLEARQRTFSILGMVARPGQYQIIQSDFRILDALTLAGDVQVQNIEYMYVVRKGETRAEPPKPAGTTPGPAPEQPKSKPVDPLEGKRSAAPQRPVNAVASSELSQHVVLLADGAAKDETEGRKVLIDGKWVPINKDAKDAKPAVTPATPATPTPAAPTPATPTPAAAPATPATPAAAVTPAAATPAAPAETATKGFEFETPKSDPDTRIIRIPLERLQHGELQYNVVVKPNDTLIIPSPKVGEYYMGGHVQRPGVYSLTGRQITLKQAIISAGMIDALGWPERTEVIRRVGRDRELFVRVNLPKVFAGQQSDIYLRPYDTINVGTNAVAPFLAALRGAFRFTYGFGFIYDRNYNTHNNNSNN